MERGKFEKRVELEWKVRLEKNGKNVVRLISHLTLEPQGFPIMSLCGKAPKALVAS